MSIYMYIHTIIHIGLSILIIYKPEMQSHAPDTTFGLHSTLCEHVPILTGEAFTTGLAMDSHGLGIGYIEIFTLHGNSHYSIYTLCLFNIAMENGPFIDGLPIRNGDFPWLC